MLKGQPNPAKGRSKYRSVEWMYYWSKKKRRKSSHRKDGYQYPEFQLSLEDMNYLSDLYHEQFGEDAPLPCREGYHLGRIDHDKGYFLGNVEWQWHADNQREAMKRDPKVKKLKEGVKRWPSGRICYYEHKTNRKNLLDKS
tara:strand:+ start:94 stop:516 length:423 start_codon:yes stop_codon:yes gene_type:complete